MQENDGNGGTINSEFAKLVAAKIENLRPKLLDLTRRNPLISTRLSGRYTSYLRAVDELPDVLFSRLKDSGKFRLTPLPSLDEDPRDEQRPEFLDAYSQAQATDEAYADALEAIDPSAEDAAELQRNVERDLKDRVRAQLGYPERHQTTSSLGQHARNNGILPHYDLPPVDDEHEDGRHTDDEIQTLLLPDQLERLAGKLLQKTQNWQQETGLNVLQAAFGALEWQEPGSEIKNFSPLVLLPAKLEKTKTPDGPVFDVSGLNEPGETNTVLAEKLRRDFDIELPAYEGHSIEEYLETVQEAAPAKIQWKVRRYVTIGVFPSARMAMYHDLASVAKGGGSNGIVTDLLVGSEERGIGAFAEDYEVDEEAIAKKVPLLVSQADSSQFSTLVDIAAGKNLAVEGPPGTGKSQTIVNAIAAALASGKKVLFVAEKMAALSVVQSRLEAMGLGDFLLPLQADRSSRQQVAASLKKRLSIPKETIPLDFKSQEIKFNRARTELKSYIDILQSEVGETGLNTHEVLGLAMRDAATLEDDGELLNELDLRSLSNFNEAQREELVVAARELADASAETPTLGDLWENVGAVHLDRFTVNELTRLADAALDLSITLDRSLDGSAVQDPNLTDQGLREVLSLLDELSKCSGQIDQSVLHSAIDPAGLERLEGLVEARTRQEALASEISSTIPLPPTAQTKALVEFLIETAEKSELSTLSQNACEGRAQALSVDAGSLTKIVNELDVLVAAESGFAGLSFKELRLVREAAHDAGQVALRSRTPELLEMGSLELITALRNQASELKDKFDSTFRKHFHMERLPSASELARIRGVVAGAGFFGFLSANVRATRQLTSQWTSSGKPLQKPELAALAALVAWKESAEAFSKNVDLLRLAGVHAAGLETDFDRLIPVAKYGARLHELFPKLSAIDARKIGKSADIDALLSIPETSLFGDQEPVSDRKALAEELVTRWTATVDQLYEAKGRLAAHNLQATLELDELKALTAKIGDYIALTEDLDERLAALGAPVTMSGPELALHLDVGGPLAELPLAFEEKRQLTNLELLDSNRELLRKASVLAGDLSDKLSALTVKARLTFREKWSEVPFSRIRKLISEASENSDGLAALSKLKSAQNRFSVAGGEAFSEAFEALDRDLSMLPEMVQAGVAMAMSQRVINQHGESLQKFAGTRLDDLRADIRNLDRKLSQTAQKRIRFGLLSGATPPSGNGRGKVSTWTERCLIEKEASKSKRHVSIRDLVSRAGRALQAYKPCWMMSPLAVAQYVPRDTVDFDLVIIDEASQMPPENAIGALLRAKQAVVVGDTNQLPPTSFFSKLLDDEDLDEDESVVDESILELANATFRPPRRLRWHYRSRHSGLISFSNRHIYDDDLVVFPSPDENRKDMGVELVEVPGLYKAGLNPTEAQAVVAAAIKLMETNPRRSLGIVALNQKQSDHIEELLAREISLSSKAQEFEDYWLAHQDGLERLIVKNLENVQGDERDVILISTVYGPEKPGARVMQRFGPINSLAGRRRLNVLLSRAKMRIVTFSSMKSADITATAEGNAGAYMLKSWLEYAATGRLEEGVFSSAEPDSVFEEFVIAQLRAMGVTADPQVGVAGFRVDIGVRHPQWPHGYLMGVECDGATYHSSKSARDRDRYRQEVLEGLGWRLYRIWSTDWFANPRKEAEKLRAAIENCLEEARRSRSTISTVDVTPVEPVSDQSDLFAQPLTSNSIGEAAETEQLEFSSAEQTSPSVSATAAVGDTVRIRFLNGDGAILQVRLSDAENDPDQGICGTWTPLAKAVLGAEEGEEIEVLVGSRIRPAIVEQIKQDAIA